MPKLDEKIAVITGGNSGIGLATAKVFVKEGARVYITGRRQAELEAAATLIGPRATPVQGDVSKLAGALTRPRHIPNLTHRRNRNLFTGNSKLFTAIVLMGLASSIAGPSPAVAAASQRAADEVPSGYYRLKVGDLEVTALTDGAAAFDLHWLTANKSTMEGIEIALHERPHLLDGNENCFLVNTGKQLILVDVGSGTWFGGGAFGHLVGSLRSAGYTPEQVDRILITHMHSDHIGGLTTQDGKSRFPNA